MTLLRLERVTAGYDGAPAIRDLDLTVETGETVALLGPNGAGKTTTLRTISGFIRPMGGRVGLDDRDTRGTAPHRLARAGISHALEGHGVFSGLTTGEHFRLGRRGQRLDTERAREHFPALVPLWERRAGLLSGGEQQMLALALALARRPRLLLIDELSLGLAPAIVQRLLPVVRRYAADIGAGVLLVEQNPHLALEMADRAYVLVHGRVVNHGPADAMRRDPELLVGSYLGAAPEPSAPRQTDAERHSTRRDT
ncbi:ATP-binding cassette domain-containing protein [Actinomadura sp. LD22]|uniref:ATP-binding cassette domain-containing protein n=1 Tax=Actinomadura physcomitrii TaxID=2650748 RepID=A0A6I4MPW7_9ACTN|nr:ATP-binding cassette domain-containing protein [Actinomadura physcomitrii]MWA05421.1 ATP-binding cassette domain-containing protein [Actinomadura physcomitrii]